jgi:pyridoxal biosynthesis lyase PdxS
VASRAIVKAATHFNDPKVLLEVSEDLHGAMKGLAVAGLDEGGVAQPFNPAIANGEPASTRTGTARLGPIG